VRELGQLLLGRFFFGALVNSLLLLAFCFLSQKNRKANLIKLVFNFFSLKYLTNIYTNTKGHHMKFNAYDLRWTFALFGTAVGAGILFLPIKAGTAGIYPVLFMLLLAFPMAFLSHLALARFCNGSTKKQDTDITDVSEEYFGFNWGYVITFLYFFAFFPACVMYGVGITNTLESLLTHQFGLNVSRFWVCFGIISLMMFVMILTEDVVIKVCEWLVYPLCAILLLFSLYLIPHWRLGEAFSTLPTFADFGWTVWLSLPVLAFAFEHTPAISTFAAAMRRHYKEQSDKKCVQILGLNSLLLLFFIMFFVISCVLALSPEDFAAAKAQNIPIVSYFANKFENPLVSLVAPLIAILAISTSFFGHYFGAREGLNALVCKGYAKFGATEPNRKKIDTVITICFYALMLGLSYANPSILGIMDTLSGPVIAAVLFLLPLAGFYKVEALRKYRKFAPDLFVFVVGTATVATVIYKIF